MMTMMNQNDIMEARYQYSSGKIDDPTQIKAPFSFFLYYSI